MHTYKRWMVGLDFTDMDHSLIRYTRFLAEIFSPDIIYFIHIEEDLEISQELKEEFPEFAAPRDEMLKEEMRQEVGEIWGPDRSLIEYKVVEGSPNKEFLHWTTIKDIDLIVAGRKQDMNGSGIIPAQLARKAQCSVLFVPENPRLALSTLWVASDFSDQAKMAAEQALALTRGHEDSTIFIHHVYTVPLGYYKTGKTELQFAQIMQHHAERRYQQFLEDIEGNTHSCQSVYTFDQEKSSPAGHVLQAAKDHKADLILLGARGRNVLTAFFLGSVAEKLIKLNADTPMLLVK
ncbi:MAG: universal stress protein [Bacteroidia bacterium]|nr:universal stress protein [Bacteroidia bacterium]